MILTVIALVILLSRDQLSEHKILFGAILLFGIIGTITKDLIKKGTAYWPDGSVDHSKSAPILRSVLAIFNVAFAIRWVLFIWICIVALNR